MKKEIKFFSLAILLILGLLTFAIADNASLENDSDGVVCAQDVKECADGSYVSRNPGNNCEFFACPDEELLGSSCGTVAPGYQEECCINKGYAGWDEEEFKCIGEGEQEKNQNKVGAVYSGKGLTQAQIQNIIQSRNRIRAYYANSSECPDGCICSGSNLKCQFENGTRTMTVYAGNSGNVIVQVKNVNASTNVTLYKENEKMYGVFRNNETKEIILPDEALEKVRERNQKRLHLEGESISLTEEGYYQIQTKKKARLFLLIPVREQVKAQVNAETGEIVRIRNPWWGFLARDNRE